MIRESGSLRTGETVACDVCIVGAGPAGITLATKLANRRVRVVLLAGGGVYEDASTRLLNAGTSGGQQYFPTSACRVRALGGTTHIWGGWLHPLDQSDFEARSWVANSGWPIPYEQLTAYLDEAHAMCGLPPQSYCAQPVATSHPLSPGPAAARVMDRISFRIAPVRLGASQHSRLASHPDVTLCLHAHAQELEASQSGSRVSTVRCVTTDGRPFSVSARLTVLAAGGLENARLLLVSERLRRLNDLVGRYFFDHLHVPIGELALDDKNAGQPFRSFLRHAEGTRHGLTLSEVMRSDSSLLASAITLHNADDPHDLLSPAEWKGGYAALVAMIRSIRRGERPTSLVGDGLTVLRHADEAFRLAIKRLAPPTARRLVLGLRSEQVPHAESRVRLSDHLDRFGKPLVHLDWRISKQDIDSIEATQRIVKRALGHARPFMYPRDGKHGWEARIRPGAHHMGTTRMDTDPARGVVDTDCRVHGVDNLYVAGSSVFPTGGSVPPTLTILALAARLAAHLGDVVLPRSGN